MLASSSPSMAGDLDPMVKMESTKGRFDKSNLSVFGKMILEQPPELENTMNLTKGNTFAKVATKTTETPNMKSSFISPTSSKLTFKARTFKQNHQKKKRETFVKDLGLNDYIMKQLQSCRITDEYLVKNSEI